MNAIKFILKWSAIFFGLILLLMIGIVTIGHFQMKQERQEAAVLKKHIANKQVVSGMTPEQVRQVWGPPDRVTKGVVHNVQVEQWIYLATPPQYDNTRYVGFREGQAVIISAGQPNP